MSEDTTEILKNSENTYAGRILKKKKAFLSRCVNSYEDILMCAI